MAKTWKAGLYLGTELPDEHPRVKAGVPLHGANLIPDDAVLPDFRRIVLEYIDQVTRLGHRVRITRVVALINTNVICSNASGR